MRQKNCTSERFSVFFFCQVVAKNYCQNHINILSLFEMRVLDFMCQKIRFIWHFKSHDFNEIHITKQHIWYVLCLSFRQSGWHFVSQRQLVNNIHWHFGAWIHANKIKPKKLMFCGAHNYSILQNNDKNYIKYKMHRRI